MKSKKVSAGKKSSKMEKSPTSENKEQINHADLIIEEYISFDFVNSIHKEENILSWN